MEGRVTSDAMRGGMESLWEVVLGEYIGSFVLDFVWIVYQ